MNQQSKIVHANGIRIDEVSYKENYGRFYVEPLERGYGYTIGNLLKRFLLFSTEGCAITGFEIEIPELARDSKFIPGVVESIEQIISNLKNLQVSIRSEKNKEEVILYIDNTGNDEILKVKANRLEEQNINKLSVGDPNSPILSVCRGAKVKMKIQVEKSIGYKTQQETIENNNGRNLLHISSIFSPVSRISFEVRQTRVGTKTDYDALVLDLWTNGLTEPKNVLSKAIEECTKFIDRLKESVEKIVKEREKEKESEIVKIKKTQDNKASISFPPFEKGLGTIIGNTLRRILLSSIDGAAITSIRIDGIEHEFSTIRGVKDEISYIILNLKKVRVAMKPNKDYTETKIEIDNTQGSKSRIVTSDDIKKNSDIEIKSPSVYITEVSKGAKFECTLGIRRGIGYSLAESLKDEKSPYGTIFIDGLFNPVKKVSFNVKPLMKDGNFMEELTLDIETDGTISPEDTILKAITILKSQFSYLKEFYTRKDIEDLRKKSAIYDPLLEYMEADIESLNLSQRAIHALKSADIKKVKQLVTKTEQELLRIENLGRNSLKNIKDALAQVGLSLGIKIRKKKDLK